MNVSANIYSFVDPREWLSAVMHERKSIDEDFSLRSFARELGYQNPSMLSQVLRGERAFKKNLADRVSRCLGLDERERKWLGLISASQSAGSPTVKLDELIATATGSGSGVGAGLQENFSLDRFRFLADWHHFAILEMIDLRDFSEDPLWISMRLGNRITAIQSSLAIDRLLRMGLLQRNRSGRLFKTNKDVFVGGSEIPSEAVQSHHRAMMDVAKDSLVRTPVKNREISGTNITIRKSDIARVKALVNKFRDDLHRIHAEKDGDEVYRINIQVFPLTQSVQKNSSKE